MSVSRREFLGATAMLPALSIPVTVGNELAGETAIRGPAGLVRKDVSSLPVNATELLAYERAVELLNQLPSQDPRSWRSLARQHMDHCPHQNWWFLPWHRAYLYYFEKCCQSVLSDPTFRLPYWDWSRNRQVPGAFWKFGSALHHAERAAGPNNELRAEVVGRDAVEKILRSNVDVSVFSGATNVTDNQRTARASGALEATLHNSVHNFVGGTMGSLLSPLDPIFWLHHANLDRLWASWSKIHNNRVPSEPRWADQKLAAFYDPETQKSVAPVTSTTRDAERYNALYDRYEDVGAVQAAVSGQRALSRLQLFDLDTGPTLQARLDRQISQATSTSVRLSTTQAFSREVAEVLGANERGDVSGAVLLALGGIERKGSVSMRIFINCPDPSVKTPTDDPTYAGTISFFGDDHAGHAGHAGGGVNVLIDVTETLAKLSATGAYAQGQNLDVSLVAVDLRSPEQSNASAVVKPSTVEIKVVN